MSARPQIGLDNFLENLSCRGLVRCGAPWSILGYFQPNLRVLEAFYGARAPVGGWNPPGTILTDPRPDLKQLLRSHVGVIPRFGGCNGQKTGILGLYPLKIGQKMHVIHCDTPSKVPKSIFRKTRILLPIKPQLFGKKKLGFGSTRGLWAQKTGQKWPFSPYSAI